jgi:hypothetical protein
MRFGVVRKRGVACGWVGRPAIQGPGQSKWIRESATATAHKRPRAPVLPPRGNVLRMHCAIEQLRPPARPRPAHSQHFWLKEDARVWLPNAGQQQALSLSGAGGHHHLESRDLKPGSSGGGGRMRAPQFGAVSRATQTGQGLPSRCCPALATQRLGTTYPTPAAPRLIIIGALLALCSPVCGRSVEHPPVGHGKAALTAAK